MKLTRPTRVRGGGQQEIRADHHNNHARCIEELQQAIPSPRKRSRSGSGYTHPFKLAVTTEGEEVRLYIHSGRATAEVWPSGQKAPQMEEVAILFNSARLRGDEFSGSSTDGYEVLADSTAYGVWLLISYTGTSTVSSSDTSWPTAPFGTFNNRFAAVGGATIGVSSTYTAMTQGPAYATALGVGPYQCFYLGQVTVGEGGAATVKQYRRSDIVVPMTSVPFGFESADTGNSLTTGSDSRLFVPPIVSTDADNSIGTGGDGGAFYNAPPVVSADSGNVITVGGDGGPFYDPP